MKEQQHRLERERLADEQREREMQEVARKKEEDEKRRREATEAFYANVQAGGELDLTKKAPGKRGKAAQDLDGASPNPQADHDYDKHAA